MFLCEALTALLVEDVIPPVGGDVPLLEDGPLVAGSGQRQVLALQVSVVLPGPAGPQVHHQHPGAAQAGLTARHTFQTVGGIYLLSNLQRYHKNYHRAEHGAGLEKCKGEYIGGFPRSASDCSIFHFRATRFSCQDNLHLH